MATGDVVVRLGEPPPRESTPEDMAAFQRQFAAKMRGEMYPEEAEEARRARLLRAEAARQAEKPLPDPWDAWRTQKAPEMFEPEVTHRG